jgi:hypothetical protein
MQFRNPEILFFLFLLLIPILIHLFHLQKFRKVPFTNVKFLKEIELETRKSSKLKKLLILLTRLLALSAIIIAFSQPYINKNKTNSAYHRIIYLDNSLSMQAKDKSGGDRLQTNKNRLIEGLANNDHSYSLVTNEKTQENLSYALLTKALLSVDFYPIKKDINQVLLEINTLQKKSPNTLFEVFLITDFQNINGIIESENLHSENNYYLIPSPIKPLENISLDTVWITDDKDQDLKIKSLVSSHQMSISDLSISLFLEDNLYGKTTLSLRPNETKEVDFSIPSTNAIDGRISLTDHRLNFDNELYFSIPEKVKTKVLVIGSEQEYLKRIYREDDFVLSIIDAAQIEHGILMDQNLIILNELDKLSNALIQSLKTFVEQNGNIVIIPSADCDFATYNNLFNTFHSGKISGKSQKTKRVNSINYDHPFFNGVFEKQIFNFQYPSTSLVFESDLIRATSLLLFEDQEGFIFEIPFYENKIYWIASPLSIPDNSFKDSPLIVPVFLNFSIQNSVDKSLYFTIGRKNEITLMSDNLSDEPLRIINQDLEYIPLQSKRNNQINISTEEFPLLPGIYTITDRQNTFQKIGYNFDRAESNLTLNNLEALEIQHTNVHFFDSTSDAIKDVNDSHKNQNLWQLFIILALVFLILEILLQKFLKN